MGLAPEHRISTIDDTAFELFAMHYGIGRGDKTKENPTGKMIMS